MRVLTSLALCMAAAAAQDKAAYERVCPSADELRWQAIDWQPTLWEGVVAAHAQQKPILLWTMNGHPLGHT